MYQLNLETIKTMGEIISGIAYNEWEIKREKQQTYKESSFSENISI